MLYLGETKFMARRLNGADNAAPNLTLIVCNQLIDQVYEIKYIGDITDAQIKFGSQFKFSSQACSRNAGVLH